MRGAAMTLLGLALVAGACGGGGGTEGGGGGGATGAPAATEAAATGQAGGGGGDGGLDVCALVDAATVESILSEPAGAGLDNSSVDLRVCSWTGSATPTEVLTVSIYVHPDAATARDQYLATTEGLGGVDILNLADEASYSDGFGLRVLSGRYDLGIDSTGDDEKISSLKLAQQILPQLP